MHQDIRSRTIICGQHNVEHAQANGCQTWPADQGRPDGYPSNPSNCLFFCRHRMPYVAQWPQHMTAGEREHINVCALAQQQLQTLWEQLGCPDPLDLDIYRSFGILTDSEGYNRRAIDDHLQKGCGRCLDHLPDRAVPPPAPNAPRPRI